MTSISRYGQRRWTTLKMIGLQTKEYFLVVACLSCDLPHTFLFRVSDVEIIFLVAGPDVFGILDFRYVDFRIETKRFPVLEDTN